MLKLAVLALLVVAAAARHRVTRDAKADVQAHIDEASKLANAGKFKEMLEGQYAEDAHYIAPNGAVVSGKQNIISFMKAIRDRIGKVSDFSFTVEDLFTDGDLFFAIGLAQFKVTRAERTTQAKHRALTLMRKTGGSYKTLVNSMFPGDGTQARPHRRTKRQTTSEKIQSIYHGLKASLQNRDISGAIATGFAEDAKYVTPCGGVVSGRQAITEYMTKKARENKIKGVENTVATIIEDGNFAVDIGQSSVTAEKDGETVTKQLRHIALWKKDGDSYKQLVRGVIKIKDPQ